MKTEKLIIQKIKTAKTIAVFTHISPDADGIGACLAFKNAFATKEIDFYLENIPDDVSFLKPDCLTSLPTKKYDLVISFDTASKKQLGIYAEYFCSHTNSISIDHHSERNDYAVINYCRNISSACELLANLLEQWKVQINSVCANYLYAGIASDTGCFCYNNTTPETHITVANLIKKADSIEYINLNLFSTYSYNELMLLKVILNNMVIKDHYVYAVVNTKQLNSNKITAISTRNFVNILLSLKNMKIACLAVEIESGKYKFSMRSKGNCDVSKIAKKYDGGGHVRASGFTLIESDQKVAKFIEKELDAVNYEN